MAAREREEQQYLAIFSFRLLELLSDSANCRLKTGLQIEVAHNIYISLDTFNLAALTRGQWVAKFVASTTSFWLIASRKHCRLELLIAVLFS